MAVTQSTVLGKIVLHPQGVKLMHHLNRLRDWLQNGEVPAIVVPDAPWFVSEPIPLMLVYSGIWDYLFERHSFRHFKSDYKMQKDATNFLTWLAYQKVFTTSREPIMTVNVLGADGVLRREMFYFYKQHSTSFLPAVHLLSCFMDSREYLASVIEGAETNPGSKEKIISYTCHGQENPIAVFSLETRNA